MKVTQVISFASAMAVAVNAYSFSDSMATTAPLSSTESTGLTVNEENRIYGGSEANIDDYPYTVNLRIDGLDTTFCGGTLIDKQYILTAGHCIKTDEYDIIAVIGSEYGSGSKGEQIKVSEGYQHPMYNQKKHLYDVGLLKLSTPSSATTATLCAEDGSDNKVGTVATVLGWGLTEDGSESNTLQAVNVEIITNAECNKEYDNRITEGMMCAGDGGGKDSCNGDSGGPLVSNDILVGFVSWGGKCGVNAGVYTRITYVMDYIKDILAGGTGSNFTDSTAASGSAESLTASSAGSAASSTAASTSTAGSTESTASASSGSTTASTSTAGSTESSTTGSSGLTTGSTTTSSSSSSPTTTTSSTGSSTTDASSTDVTEAPTTASSSSGVSTASGSSTDQVTQSATPAPTTPTVTEAPATEAPTTTAPTTSGGKGCSVRRARRRLTSINEEDVEEDMDAAEKAKAVAQQKETEAEEDIEDAKETSNEEELEDAQEAKTAAEKEEEDAEEEVEEDEAEEEEDEKEEEKNVKDAEDGTEEEEEEEDEDQSSESDSEGKEEAKEDEEDQEEENEEEEDEAENGKESDEDEDEDGEDEK